MNHGLGLAQFGPDLRNKVHDLELLDSESLLWLYSKTEVDCVVYYEFSSTVVTFLFLVSLLNLTEFDRMAMAMELTA